LSAQAQEDRQEEEAAADQEGVEEDRDASPLTALGAAIGG